MDRSFTAMCKSAFLTEYDSTNMFIETQEDLLHVLQLTCRDPTLKQLRNIWKDREDMSFKEFCSVAQSIPKTNEREILKAFRALDANNDGFLSSKELSVLLTTKGEKMKLNDVQSVIDEFDRDNDGRLNYIEFSEMFASTLDKSDSALIESMDQNTIDNRTPSSERKNSKIGGKTGTFKKDDIPLAKPRNINSRKGSTAIDDEDAPVINRSSLNTAKSIKSPKHIQDWKHHRTMGSIHIDDEHDTSGSQSHIDNINEDEEQPLISQYYQLRLESDSDVYITIKPRYVLNHILPIDTMLFILNSSKTVISMTTNRDTKGTYSFRGDLCRGRYHLVVFSTGCRLSADRKCKDNEKPAKLVETRANRSVLTQPFKDVLDRIFSICDLNNDNVMSREEFTIFTQRTCGEQVGDDEWDLVKESVEMSSQQKDAGITRNGFLELNEMEASQDSSDYEDLWLTLTYMGFNKKLQMDACCPFEINVYTEINESSIKVLGWNEDKNLIPKALYEFAKNKGQTTKLNSAVSKISYVSDSFASVIIDNTSQKSVKVSVDLSKCQGVQNNMADSTVTLEPDSFKTVCNLMPSRDDAKWSVKVGVNLLR